MSPRPDPHRRTASLRFACRAACAAAVGGGLSIVLSRIVLLTVLPMSAASCSRPPIDDLELIAGIDAFELAIAGQPREIVQELLRAHARSFKRRVVRVQAAVIAAAYTREKASQVYFGVNYDANDHLYLREIDPPLHAALEHHRHWVSVIKTYPSRQISYELPVDESTFARMEPGREVSFSCSIAALIRRTSVYCIPLEVSIGR